jgi:hypothetical protein
VRAPLREIDAGAREHASASTCRIKVDVEGGELRLSQPRQHVVASVGREPARSDHRLEHLHRHLAGEVPVAGARVEKLQRHAG